MQRKVSFEMSLKIEQVQSVAECITAVVPLQQVFRKQQLEHEMRAMAKYKTGARLGDL